MLHTLHRHLDAAGSDKTLHRHDWGKIGIRCLIIGIALVVIAIGGYCMQDHIPAIEAWIKEQGALAPFIFISLIVFLTIFLVPADILIFTASVLFGLWWGYCYSIIAVAIGMFVQFYVGRHILRSKVESFMANHPKFAAIDKAVAAKGLKIAFLLRLGPVPLAPLNYILSVSKIRFREYLLSGPGQLPTMFAVCYYGNMAAHLAKRAAGLEHHSSAHYASMIFGGVVAVIATVYISRVAKNALKEADAL